MRKLIVTIGAFALGGLLMQPAFTQESGEGAAAEGERSSQSDDAFLYQEDARSSQDRPDANASSQSAQRQDRPMSDAPMRDSADDQPRSPEAADRQGLPAMPPPGQQGDDAQGFERDQQSDQRREFDTQRDPMSERQDFERNQQSQQFDRRDQQFDRGADNRADGRFDRGGDDWRFVEHQGRWWYWTPNRTWLYHEGGDWQAYRGSSPDRRYSSGQPRYEVGYRGGSQGSSYVDPCACPSGAVIHHGGYSEDRQSGSGSYESRRAYSDADRGENYDERTMMRSESREGQFDGRQDPQQRSMGLQDRPAPPRDNQTYEQQSMQQQGTRSPEKFRSSDQQQQPGSMETRSGQGSNFGASPSGGDAAENRIPGREGTGADNTPPSNPGTLDPPRDR